MAEVPKLDAAAQGKPSERNAGLGQEIRAVRRAMGMTLNDCAEAASLSVGFLSLVERGQKQPSLEALQRISAALGIEIGWLFPPSPNDDPVENKYVVRKGFRLRIDYSRLGTLRDKIAPGTPSFDIRKFRDEPYDLSLRD